jgi:hypothetical protein
MRPVLRLLGTRYGMALVLAVLVLAVVGVMRGVAGSNRQTLGAAVEPSRSSSIDPTAGDDSVLIPESPSPPYTSPGAADPTIIATNFLKAWLTHDGVTAEQWQAGFAKYATSALRDKLKGADPAGVPAERMTGAAVLQDRGAAYVEAAIPVDSGTVRLRLLATNGRWLVDGVDWERS